MTLSRRVGRERIAAAATAVALACGGGDGDNEPTGNTGSIQVGVSPTTLPVQQGGSGSVTVSLTRGGGFSGVVTLAVTGFPTGITATVTPAQLSGTETSATVSTIIAAAVAAGTYTGTITATGQGVTQATASYQVTVTAPPAADTDVEYRYCDASQAPVFFAYQDGTGAWQRVTGSTAAGTTKFSFRLRQARGGVLAVFSSASSAVASALTVGRNGSARHGFTRSLHTRDRIRARLGAAAGAANALERSSLADAYQTEVLYASAAELAQDGIDNCALTRPTQTATGTVAGVSSGQYGSLALGGSNVLFIGGTTTNPVTFADVPGGTIDFVGTRWTPGTPPNKAVLFRNLDVSAGESLPATVDFDGPGAIVPASATATVTGAGGDDLEIFTELITANSQLLFWFDLAPSKVTVRPWAGLGSAAMVTGDFHAVVVFAGTEEHYRVSLKYVGPVADETLALGPTIVFPLFAEVSAGVYPRFRFTGRLPSEYSKGVSIDLVSAADDGNAYSIIATSAYLTPVDNGLAYDFTMPDVAGLPGFPAAARLSAGPNATTIGGFGFTGPGIFDLRPTLGSEFRAVATTGNLMIP